jgi:hypothetical protein
MADDTRLRGLRIVLVAAGLVCVFGFYPLTVLWPSGGRRARATRTT